MPLLDLKPKLQEILGKIDLKKQDLVFTKDFILEVENFIASVINKFGAEKNVAEAIELLKEKKLGTLATIAGLCPDGNAAKSYLQLMRILIENGATIEQVTELLMFSPPNAIGFNRTFGAILLEYNAPVFNDYMVFLNKLMDLKVAADKIFSLIQAPTQVVPIRNLLAILITLPLKPGSHYIDVINLFNFLEKLNKLGVESKKISELTNYVSFYNSQFWKLYYTFKTNPALLVRCLSLELIHEIQLEDLKKLKNLVLKHTLTLPDNEKRDITLKVKTPGTLLNKFMNVKRPFLGLMGLKPDPESRTRGEFGKFNKLHDEFSKAESLAERQTEEAILQQQLELAAALSLEEAKAKKPAAAVVIPDIVPNLANEAILAALRQSALISAPSNLIDLSEVQPPPSYTEDMVSVDLQAYLTPEAAVIPIQYVMAPPSVFGTDVVLPSVNPAVLYPHQYAPGHYAAPSFNMNSQHTLDTNQYASLITESQPVVETTVVVVAKPEPVAAPAPQPEKAIEFDEVEVRNRLNKLHAPLPSVTQTSGTLYNAVERTPVAPKVEEKKVGAALTG